MFSGLKETIEEDAKTLVYESMKKKLKLLLLLKENSLFGLEDPFFLLFLPLNPCGLLKLNMKNLVLLLYIENAFVNKYYYYLLISFF